MGLVHRRGGRRLPKSTGAPDFSRTIYDRFGALEADFLRDYRLDLDEIWLRANSWRRFMVLIEGLPSTSAFWSMWSAEKQRRVVVAEQREQTMNELWAKLGLPPSRSSLTGKELLRWQ